jgi:hypothetical protein
MFASNRYKHTSTEWIIAIALFMWGAILLSNPTNFYTQPNFASMRHYARVEVWAAVTMIFGFIRLMFLSIMWRYSVHGRLATSCTSLVTWSILWVAYVSVGNPIPNLATIGALIAIDAASVWRTAAEAKVSDLIRRGHE